jgi:hypothetical protein
LPLEFDAHLHLIRGTQIERPNLIQERVIRRRTPILVFLEEANLFLSLPILPESTIDQRESVMGGTEVWKQRASFAVGIGRPREIAAGRANPSQPVVSISIIRVLFQDRTVEFLASAPVGGSE